MAANFTLDANDVLYQWDSSRDYNPQPQLERITATLLAINSADDERNPPELGVMERELKRIPNGALFLIPGSADTFGHGTTGNARFWKARVEALLRSAPRR
jgi:homoserine O-acetyltransferase